MKLKKLIIQVVMLIGVGFIYSHIQHKLRLAFTSGNFGYYIDDIKVELKQINEISKPTWQIINSSDGRDGKYHSHLLHNSFNC
jgi:hypothetical protein